MFNYEIDMNVDLGLNSALLRRLRRYSTFSIIEIIIKQRY